MITVICTTYNHASYILQTLEGFATQRCSYPFEVLVHDDASTDGTADIIRKFSEEHPGLCRLILQSENQYSKGVDIWQMLVCNHTQAKYIAICEGDDYWTDPLKLQKQVDFLELHPDFGLAYSRARCFYQTKQKKLETIGFASDSFRQILLINPIPTLTVLFRRNLALDYYTEINPIEMGWKMGDYPLWLYIASRSKIWFLNETTAIYRVLPNSASHSTDYSRRIAFLENTHAVKHFFAQRDAKDMTDLIDRQIALELLECGCRYGNPKLAREARSKIKLLQVKLHSARLRLSSILSHLPWFYIFTIDMNRKIKNRN